MELEKFEEVYQVLEAQKEKDETAAELYADVKELSLIHISEPTRP